MDRLVRADTLHHRRRFFRLLAPVGEDVLVAHDRAAEGEETLGPNLDHQHVHEQQDELLESRRELRHQPPRIGPADALGHLWQRIAVRTEHEVARREPHGVMRAILRLRRIAAFIRAMRVEQSLVQMSRTCLRDIVLDDRLEVRRLKVAKRPAPRLDHTGNRERIPEWLSVAVREKKSLLGNVGIIPALQKLHRRIDQRPTLRRKLFLPCRHRRPAVEHAGRHIGAVCQETAMQLVSRPLVRSRISVRRHKLVSCVGELCHLPVPP